MPISIAWHEVDARHHSGDLSVGGTVIKGAVSITLQGGSAVFDVNVRGKKHKSKPQSFTELKTLKLAAEFFLISACGEDAIKGLAAAAVHLPPSHESS